MGVSEELHGLERNVEWQDTEIIAAALNILVIFGMKIGIVPQMMLCALFSGCVNPGGAYQPAEAAPAMPDNAGTVHGVVSNPEPSKIALAVRAEEQRLKDLVDKQQQSSQYFVNNTVASMNASYKAALKEFASYQKMVNQMREARIQAIVSYNLQKAGRRK